MDIFKMLAIMYVSENEHPVLISDTHLKEV
ncbi:hypothetical protein C8E01_11012 [Pontibacter virosus]|uniref:Uncharacterized protein n=1 Tax=Pontibacter virosus TaxID=1765052 RepID=A0A2U1ATB6_9BACT|nr:hypothetical protein C8E01_11012 [Pontibacter virosus]